ncbi:MAG: SAM-dependent methyltransferase [Gallionellaceae bacterium CG1_02_56_997]|nr:MAG: SAM-dependent methyltransferase [Gallionellaceae bacterium CG1_02_56_997]PIY00906.1 MAG: SAM-dependent methyltransferase [Hydrogenophilales bacterium CG_4_10_14_3_um_filter_58_23]
MNKSKLKTYAPQARKDFIAAVTARANLLGLSDSGGKLEVAIGERKGDIAIIAGMEWSAKVYELRERLVQRMKIDGFSHTVEAVAYTWFNRFAALRYMEIHDYLDHGYRALSNREGGMPEILNHATELDLPGLNKDRAVEFKLAGDKDGELYKMLLVAQCNALSRSMPFLFEHIDDETELLLPDNLLRTDSVIAKLVASIPEEDWQEVEIIGWLYQFYISEKKDEVIGKVVKSEDIPAATQLFTPNWIVKYLVQNSVGRLWLMANPASTLKSQWAYYIEPAEQTPEVQAQLDALIQTRMDEDGGSLNPETITMLDPACGSGHILVEAYEVLKGIYLERGYRLRDIPRLILEKNLYGLDIDDRAAQLAGFALLMKARADDRRLLDNPPKLNVLALQESMGLDADAIVQALFPSPVRTRTSGFGDDDLFPGSRPQMSFDESMALKSNNNVRAEPVEAQSIRLLIDTFAHAKTFGSLIQIPQALNVKLATMTESLQQAIKSGDLYAESAAQQLLPLVEQARVLGMQFDAVVANPPYMGGNYMTPLLKEIGATAFEIGKADLFSMFMVRMMESVINGGYISLMTPFTWMNLSSYEGLRLKILETFSLQSLIQPEYHSFFESAYVPICTFSIQKSSLAWNATFIDLSPFYGEDKQSPNAILAIRDKDCSWRFERNTADFLNVPGNIIAYSLGDRALKCFDTFPALADVAALKQGLITGDNNRFLRFWHEVSIGNSSIFKNKSQAKWFPYQKGGAFRKWYGNNEYFVNWESDGAEIRNFFNDKGRLRSRPQNIQYFFRQGLTWTSLTISALSMRHVEEGFIFDAKGPMCFPNSAADHYEILGYTNSRVIDIFLKELAPTMDYSQGPVGSVPFTRPNAAVKKIVEELVDISKLDWDAYEISWGFKDNSLVYEPEKILKDSWLKWEASTQAKINHVQQLETENNRLFIEAYGLQDELSPEVPEDKITLARADREKDCQRLISYAIGCMMGRYSLDEPGLIYAHAGNIGFDATRYQTFPADADGIVPLTDEFWFEDDAANRIREFLLAVWGAETLNENMAWLAESLGMKGNETPEETIRRYLASSFFKNHLQTYKKRPIYWLFSSGKQGAFQALVYLHRYHEGTLARMRAEYVVPLTSKIQSRIEMLTKDAEVATVTSARNKINKEIEVLRKKHVELLAYDEKLRHYADMRIQLDLDDGVKVNYGKFGDLLAEVKAVTGGSGDE